MFYLSIFFRLLVWRWVILVRSWLDCCDDCLRSTVADQLHQWGLCAVALTLLSVSASNSAFPCSHPPPCSGSLLPLSCISLSADYCCLLLTPLRLMVMDRWEWRWRFFVVLLQSWFGKALWSGLRSRTFSEPCTPFLETARLGLVSVAGFVYKVPASPLWLLALL